MNLRHREISIHVPFINIRKTLCPANREQKCEACVYPVFSFLKFSAVEDGPQICDLDRSFAHSQHICSLVSRNEPPLNPHYLNLPQKAG